eukprot:1320090-Pyramimonas_sp.AAC.2
MASICASFQGLSLGAGAAKHAPAKLSFSATLRGTPLRASTSKAVARTEGFTVYAKQNALKRVRTAEKARMQNKSRKSEIFTRSKKVYTTIDGLVKAGATNEDEFKAAESLISATFKVIDSSVAKGTLHKNTADRRKSKLCRYKTRALEKLGLYTSA